MLTLTGRPDSASEIPSGEEGPYQPCGQEPSPLLGKVPARFPAGKRGLISRTARKPLLHWGSCPHGWRWQDPLVGDEGRLCDWARAKPCSWEISPLLEIELALSGHAREHWWKFSS
uniref:Uncharacterized protein n=1 Tax=Sphaerodactylus townsendi TaxID=933632 RepID=A0ACB8FP14_9SAUR